VLNRLLPRPLDDTYRGHRLALWLLALLVLSKLAMGLNSVLNGYSVMTTADGIPLDTFPPAAARTAVSLFALLGLSHLMSCLLGAVALVRYRGLVPFVFSFLLLEHLGRRLILQFVPPERAGALPGFYINLALLALMVVGLALSLWGRGGPRTRR
jgi:hypothetical protein